MVRQLLCQSPKTSEDDTEDQSVAIGISESSDDIFKATRSKEGSAAHMPTTRQSSHFGVRKKVPLLVPIVSLDGISFYSEESIILWKYVVQHKMSKKELLNHVQDWLKVMKLIVKIDLVKTMLNLGPFYL